jgi:hypothetical protein
MINPLDRDEPFPFEGMNPNPSFSKTKDGPVYRVSFEVDQDTWQQFVDTYTGGMVIEAQMEVTARNIQEPKKTPGPKPDKPKGGNLSKQAGIMCNNPAFQQYAADTLSSLAGEVFEPDYNQTILFVRSTCGVESRAEIDHSPEAAKAFKDLMHDYSQWNNPGE